MSRLLDLLRRADAGLAELARLARKDEKPSRSTEGVNGRSDSNAHDTPMAAKSSPGDGGKQRRFDRLQRLAEDIALRLSQETVDGFALGERLAYAGLSNDRAQELLATAGLLLASLEASDPFRHPYSLFPTRQQLSLAVELLERMNEIRTAAGQTVTTALSTRLLTLIVLLAQFEVAPQVPSGTTSASASSRSLRTSSALRRMRLLPLLQVLTGNDRAVAFAFLRLFALAQWRGLKSPALSTADWNRLAISIIHWRLETLHSDGGKVLRTALGKESGTVPEPKTRTGAAADEMAATKALLQATAVVLLESDKGIFGSAAFLRIEGAWKTTQGTKLEPEKNSALTLEIRRIYLLPKILARMMVSAPELRPILALAFGRKSNATNGARGATSPHGVSSCGLLYGQCCRRIVRRLTKLLQKLLLDLGAAEELVVIRDPLAPEEERTVFPASEAVVMERRWIWRWIQERLWRWIDQDVTVSETGMVPATAPSTFTAQSRQLPVFELIACESLPKDDHHASGKDTSLAVLGHKLMLGPMASSIRRSFIKALRDIKATVTANPGLEDYYFLVINRRESSASVAKTGADYRCGSLQSLTAVFIECGRLPPAALWASDAAAAGVLLFHESTGSPQDWVTTRRTPFSGRIAEGYVFVLDANPARMFAMDRNVSSGSRDDSRSRTEDERLQWQQALMCSLAKFVWLSAVKKLLMKVKSERPPLLTPIEELARTAARFPTLTQSVLSPEAGFAMQGLLPEGEIARLQSMSNVSMILENQRLRAAQKVSGNVAEDANMPAFLKRRIAFLTAPKKGQSGARLNTPWRRRPESSDMASGSANGKAKAFRKHNPLNPRHPFHV